jgi:YcxB-like protein
VTVQAHIGGEPAAGWAVSGEPAPGVTVTGADVRGSVPLEIEYELTRDDLYAFQWRGVFVTARGRRARRNTYLTWVLAILIFAIVPAIGADGFVISRVSFTFIVVAILIAFLFQWCLERWLIRRTILRLLQDEKPDKGHLGRHTLVVSQHGVVESTAVGESRTAWGGVDRIEQDPHYIFIYTSPAAAHIIPKRAFREPEEADAFYQFSRARTEAAR